ncbi:hypothetical protein MUN88_15225 [Gracilibacillus caseinilyticus]|uniref:Uncharacterized protein n=1 Tax=Gracilibacillus caseinilyticus TaxID=2932256 RepID=A0ABY4ESK4_9BACI|nr:hypothetical protein [Gracilibacillus caseinilyticus]UOQ47410.1 hypothetical protein MUN88_15225 [Gracilibacillus caseinilyticus]
MNEILSFIVPIIAVVVWLFGLGKSDQKEQQKQKQSPAKPVNPSTMQQSKPTISERSEEVSTELDTTFAQQKEQQMEKLKAKLGQSGASQEQSEQPLGEHNALKDKPLSRPKKQQTEKEVTLSIAKNLNKKGIAQGIIMAEVLGPPRAYQNRNNTRINR